MLNRVTFIGNLGRDPEVRRLENGIAVATFSIATNESYKDKNGEWQDQTEWHNIVCWRYLAERAESQLKKGSMVYLEGKLTHRKYQTKEGQDRYITEVVASTFRVLNRRENNTGFAGATPTAADMPPQFAGNNNTNNSAENSASSNNIATPENIVESADDDLPF